jgi:hypothetical protein
MGAANDLIRDSVAVLAEIDASLAASAANKLNYIETMPTTAWDALCAASGVTFSKALKQTVISNLQARVRK